MFHGWRTGGALNVMPEVHLKIGRMGAFLRYGKSQTQIRWGECRQFPASFSGELLTENTDAVRPQTKNCSSRRQMNFSEAFGARNPRNQRSRDGFGFATGEAAFSERSRWSALLSRPRFKMGITSCGKTIPPFPALDNTVSCRCIHRSDSVRSLAVYRFLPLTTWGRTGAAGSEQVRH